MPTIRRCSLWAAALLVAVCWGCTPPADSSGTPMDNTPPADNSPDGGMQEPPDNEAPPDNDEPPPSNDNTPPPANENDNDSPPPANDNETPPDNTNDNGEDEGLSAAQEEAIVVAVEDIQALGQALGGFFGVFAALEALENDPLNLEGGNCPAVRLDVGPQGAVIVLDYGDGCTSALYGSAVVSGTVSAALNPTGGTLMVTLDAFTIDDRTMDGTLTETRQSDDGETTLLLAVDLTISDLGRMLGEVTAAFDINAQVIRIPSGLLNLEDLDGGTLVVAIDDLILDPKNNGNFIPESGTVTIDVPNEGPGPEIIPVTVTFSEDSPVDGTVTVSVGGAPPMTYTLPMAD
jgi:hypothetical protein